MKKNGFTLVEVLIGTTLMLIVFLGIFGLIRLAFKMVGQSKARITATALANQKIELVRNLSYNDVGTIGGIPAGTIPETEDITQNRIIYTVKTTVVYIDDPFDGLAPTDPLPTDYKRVKVNVSWSGFLGGNVFLQTDVAPKGVETTGSGGIISVRVFDANGQPVPQADVHIENNAVSPAIDAHYQTNNAGGLFLPGAPACSDCYKITVTKSGYSSDRTYAVGEVINGQTLATPARPLVSVILNETSEVSFSIDRLASLSVQTIKYVEEKTWVDLFNDQTKIDSQFQVVASTTLSAISLADQGGQYYDSGNLISIAIAPTNLVEWGRLIWTDNQSQPSSTHITYQLLYATSSGWELIPDEDLTVNGIKNSDGFANSPLDISGLDPYRYPTIKIKANLSTTDPAQTPLLYDWTVSWFSSDTTTPIGNVAFALRGAKTLGTDSNGQSIYKYQQNFVTSGAGQIDLPDLEWDSYQITIDGSATGYDIANSVPVQPINLNPAASQAVTLKLANHQTNTLLVTVENAGGVPLAGAVVRLHNFGYDKQRLTSESGQVFFSPLASGSYTLEVTLNGYQDWISSPPITISGQTSQIVNLVTP